VLHMSGSLHDSHKLHGLGRDFAAELLGVVPTTHAEYLTATNMPTTYLALLKCALPGWELRPVTRARQSNGFDEDIGICTSTSNA